MSRITAFATFFLVLATALPATAREDGAPARALGMSDAVRALGFGTSGLYYNPATMSQGMQYAIDLGYGYRAWAGRHNGHVSLVDSKTNPHVAGGIAYAYSRGKRGSVLTQTHDIRSGVSSSIRSKGIFFAYGGGFRYMKIEAKDSKNSRNNMDKWAPTLDVGVLLGVNDLFYIGVAGVNLIQMPVSKVSRSTDRGIPYAPRAVGIGVAIVYSILHFGVDVDIDLQSKDGATVSPLFGLELTLAKAIAVRAGFAWDRVGTIVQDQKRISAGLGYVSKYVGIDVGYAHDVTDADNWVIESSVRVFLP